MNCFVYTLYALIPEKQANYTKMVTKSVYINTNAKLLVVSTQTCRLAFVSVVYPKLNF